MRCSVILALGGALALPAPKPALHFGRFDKDGDGHVSFDDIRLQMEHEEDAKLPPSKLSELHAAMGDSGLLAVANVDKALQAARAAFDAHDSDADGVWSLNETSVALTRANESAPESLAHRIHREAAPHVHHRRLQTKSGSASPTGVTFEDLLYVAATAASAPRTSPDLFRSAPSGDNRPLGPERQTLFGSTTESLLGGESCSDRRKAYNIALIDFPSSVTNTPGFRQWEDKNGAWYRKMRTAARTSGMAFGAGVGVVIVGLLITEAAAMYVGGTTQVVGGLGLGTAIALGTSAVALAATVVALVFAIALGIILLMNIPPDNCFADQRTLGYLLPGTSSTGGDIFDGFVDGECTSGCSASSESYQNGACLNRWIAAPWSAIMSTDSTERWDTWGVDETVNNFGEDFQVETDVQGFDAVASNNCPSSDVVESAGERIWDVWACDRNWGVDGCPNQYDWPNAGYSSNCECHYDGNKGAKDMCIKHLDCNWQNCPGTTLWARPIVYKCPSAKMVESFPKESRWKVWDFQYADGKVPDVKFGGCPSFEDTDANLDNSWCGDSYDGATYPCNARPMWHAVPTLMCHVK